VDTDTTNAKTPPKYTVLWKAEFDYLRRHGQDQGERKQCFFRRTGKGKVTYIAAGFQQSERDTNDNKILSNFLV
jgi:hypothetical protein